MGVDFNAERFMRNNHVEVERVFVVWIKMFLDLFIAGLMLVA